MREYPWGAICYAGLDKQALFRQAQRAFAGDGPERFAAFLPLFPVELLQRMPWEGKGFSVDPAQYHRQLSQELPALYAGDNYRRNFDYEGRFTGRGVMAVDQAWADAFPQYQPFLGERLCVYPVGGGPLAVATPESVYPRGRGVLHSVETDMRVRARCEDFRAFLQGREADAEAAEGEYIAQNGFAPVFFRQAELGRLMQDLDILKSLESEPETAGLYTETARRAEHIAQYEPGKIACDTFFREPVTRSTARLCQLFFAGDDFISDLWMPYQDVVTYVDRARKALDVAALCQGFQIPPRYDPQTGGGRYPDRLRVAVVRERDAGLMVADVLNNPAYGGGMNPLGLINRRVYLADSRELLRLDRLREEEAPFSPENLTVAPEEYRRMLCLAALQEKKGALIDQMYRRQAALSRLKEGGQAYAQAKRGLDQRVERLEADMRATESAPGAERLSGYDADLHYLRRMEKAKEPPADGKEPMPFVPDALRAESIESGYAMRNGLCRRPVEELLSPVAQIPGEEG